jgi:hypothetical protein
MSKVILVAMIASLSSAVALADQSHEIANGPPSSASCLPSPGQHDGDRNVASDTPDGADSEIPDESQQIKIAVARARAAFHDTRLRAAFHDEAEEALVQREDAMAAAAEIDQLWAALWTLVNDTKDASPPHFKIWIEAVAVLAHKSCK